jgi:hypothetical protein
MMISSASPPRMRADLADFRAILYVQPTNQFIKTLQVIESVGL